MVVGAAHVGSLDFLCNTDFLATGPTVSQSQSNDGTSIDSHGGLYKLNTHVLLHPLPYVPDCPKTKESNPVVTEPAHKARESCCSIAAIYIGCTV
jgi:hypothetical protein